MPNLFLSGTQINLNVSPALLDDARFSCFCLLVYVNVNMCLQNDFELSNEFIKRSFHHELFFGSFRHQKTIHPEWNTAADEEMTPVEEPAEEKQDPVYNYHCARLAFGLFLAEINDAIKEGDGERLLDAYRLALLFYHHYGHPKYAYVVLLHLVQIKALLPESEAFDVVHNRFHNERGGKGCNIPLDLRKEQDHHIIKPMWKSLGSNLNESNAARIAHSQEGLVGVLSSADRDCEIHGRKGHRSLKSPVETVEQIVKDLSQQQVFELSAVRDGHPSFHNFPSNLLHNLDYWSLHNWMTENIKLWGSIYERAS